MCNRWNTDNVTQTVPGSEQNQLELKKNARIVSLQIINNPPTALS